MEWKEAVKEITTFSRVKLDPRMAKAFPAGITPCIHGMEGRGKSGEAILSPEEIDTEPPLA